jgi:hypothetical protein
VSHHFDTDQAKNDPRLNCCDVYLFQGRPGHTVLAMTSNADAGISSPDAFHPEGVYAIRVDTDGDAKEDVVFKLRFGEPRHATGDEHRHVQSFKVIQATGAHSAGLDGKVIAEGATGATVEANGVRAYAGLAPELWAADALAFFTTLTNLFSEDKYDPATFQNRQNLFQNRNERTCRVPRRKGAGNRLSPGPLSQSLHSALPSSPRNTWSAAAKPALCSSQRLLSNDGPRKICNPIDELRLPNKIFDRAVSTSNHSARSTSGKD